MRLNIWVVKQLVLSLTLGLTLSLACLAGYAQAPAANTGGVQPIPAAPSAHVMDQTFALNATEKAALEEKLTAFEKEHGSQIAVLIVQSTQPEDIFSYAQRVASTWKIGRKGVGDGLLIVVAKNDHKVSIQVAKTLEGAIPDATAMRIIRESLVPSFTKGNFAAGLNNGVDTLSVLIDKEKLAAPAQQTGTAGVGANDGAGNTGNAGNDSASGGLLDSLLPAIFFGVIASFILSGMLGRFLGVLGAAGVAGVAGLTMSGSIGIAVFAGIAALVVATVMGAMSNLTRGGQGAVLGRRGGFGAPMIFGGGGFGGGGGGFSGGFGGGGGGFSSGGGGDFGGGGASGSW